MSAPTQTARATVASEGREAAARATVVPLGALALGRRHESGAPVMPPMPAALVDGQRRAVRYLRLSVTDRCSYRCVYCMPEEGLAFTPRAEVLTYEELIRLTRVFATLGVTRVRLTGGEPLLRRDVVRLVAGIAAIPEIDDVALSTNGHQLAELARPLADAGLTRVNVSLDSLDPARFERITRTGALGRVLAGLEAAQAAGLGPIKLNTVVIGGHNDDELAGLVTFAAEHGYLPRFIEFMPIGVDGFWSDASFVSTAQMMARLARDFTLAPLGDFAKGEGVVGGGPARHAWLTPVRGGPPVQVGFVSALSHNFCSTCNRVRLTAVGTLQECLAYPGSLSLRDRLRQGASDSDLAEVIADALWGKSPGHRFVEGLATRQSMSITGG